MGIVWFNQDLKQGLATFYDSNITLNKTAIKNFENCDAVLLGIDYSQKKVVIKPSTTEERNSYKISIAPSYGRITNKYFMKEIMKLLDMSFTNPLKLGTDWDEKEKILIIDLKGSVKK